jgi:hypothetical protein
MNDLWPENLTANKVRSPLTLLKEQAALLGQKTQNAVQAQVRSIESVSLKSSGTLVRLEEGTVLRYEFCILAPRLGSYRYKLFTVSYDINIYPAVFNVDEGIAEELGLEENGTEAVAESEEAFLGILKKILRSERTKEIIQVLFSQSADIQSGPE